VTVRDNPATQKRLDMNEWQVDGIAQALAEAEKPDAVFISHDEVLAKWEAKKEAH
jgi:predicted transcriptional regulator